MKRISIWAYDHKFAARILIVGIYVLLNITGLILGDILHSMQIEFNFLFFFVAVLITLTGIVIYPKRKNKSKYRNFYFTQKTGDFLLSVATFLFIIYTGNVANNSGFILNKATYAISILNTNTEISKDIDKLTQSKKDSRLDRKSIRKQFKSKIKELRKKYKEPTRTEKTIYIILAVLLASFLFTGLTALACSLSCSGSEAIAFIIYFLGLGGIIFGLIKLIQRITRGKRRKKMNEIKVPE